VSYLVFKARVSHEAPPNSTRIAKATSRLRSIEYRLSLFNEVVLKLITEKGRDPALRRAAAGGAAGLGIREAIPGLVEDLQDEHGVLGEVAVEALGRLGAREAIPILVQWLRDNEDNIDDYA
jgi:HEAT repeat protein